MIDFKLELPDDFDDYSWEVESKGWFDDAIAVFDGNRYRVAFYDQARLAQDIDEELDGSTVFFEPNLLVVKSVDRNHMERAIESIAKDGKYVSMVRAKTF